MEDKRKQTGIKVTSGKGIFNIGQMGLSFCCVITIINTQSKFLKLKLLLSGENNKNKLHKEFLQSNRITIVILQSMVV